MNAGQELMVRVCLAPQPQEALTDLRSDELQQLASYLDAHAPATGMAGMLRGLVTVEAARRYLS